MSIPHIDEMTPQELGSMADALAWIAEYGSHEGDLLDEQVWADAMRCIAKNTLGMHT